jgi:general secretion pathway protein H
MTLIEILIVIVIIALAAGGITMGLGALGRSHLRSACVKIAAASRFAYNRSITRGTTVRVVLDLDANTIAIEEAHGRVALARSDDSTREELDEDAEDRAAVDPWAAAQARLSKTLVPSFGASPFGPITDEDGDAIERYLPHAVARSTDVDVARVIVPHEPEPREHGRGAIYYFPAGQTEHAVVWITDDGGEKVYSVEIHPLTGRATVHDFAFEPEVVREDADDEERSEVEDPS